MGRYIPFAIVATVLFIVAVSAGVFMRIKQQHAAAVSAAAAVAVASAPVPEPGAQPPHVRGGGTAPVTLEEFGDFECPPCGNLSPILEKIEEDYGGRLRVIFRQFPLAIHRHASEAARASEAAGRQGRFWEMHDLLYHNRFLWPRAPDIRIVFNDYAKTLGLDLERFSKEMESEQVAARVSADQRRGAFLGVDRTPAIFINNRRVPETSLNPPALHELINAAMNVKTEAAKNAK